MLEILLGQRFTPDHQVMESSQQGQGGAPQKGLCRVGGSSALRILCENGSDPVVGVDALACPRNCIARAGSMTMPFPGFCGDSGPCLRGKPKDSVLTSESGRKQIKCEPCSARCVLLHTQTWGAPRMARE